MIKLMWIAVFVILGLTLAPYSFVNGWRFAAVGDIECKDVKNLAAKIKLANVQIVLLLGDLGYGSSSKCVKDAFGTIGKATVGNHDSESNIKSVWGITNTIQTYKYENIRFLSLNTEKDASFQKSRVQGLLNKYKNDSAIDFIIPFMHKPFVTNPSAHHKESEAKGFRTAFLPMFQVSGKVPLVLFGHNHGYQQCNVGEMLFITSGAGGRDPYSWGSQMDDNCKYNLTGKDGFLVADVNGPNIVGVFKDLNNNVNEDTTFQIVK